MPSTWMSGPQPAGAYVVGAGNGRLHDLESQVELLTNTVDAWREVIRIERGGDVRIAVRKSLVLESPPTHIEIKETAVNMKGKRWPGKNIADCAPNTTRQHSVHCSASHRRNMTCNECATASLPPTKVHDDAKK